MKHIFFLALLLCFASAGTLFAQDADSSTIQEEPVAVVDADNPGMGILDQATEAKLNASTVADLSQVILLCQRAKNTGLIGENLAYCNQLLASTQLQRGLFLAQSVLTPQGIRTRDWQTIRQKALMDLEESVAVVKTQPTPYVRIAQLNLLPDGDGNRAREVLKLAIQSSKDEPALQLQAIRMLGALEPEPEKREAVLADAAKNGSPEIKLLHALTLFELDRNTDAMNVLKNLIESENDNTGLHDRIVAALAGLGKHELAMKVLDMSGEEAADERKSRIELMKAELYFKMEEDDQALTLLNALDKKLQGHAESNNTELKMDLLRLRSSIYFAMDDADKALKDIETAEKLSPDFPPILLLKYNLLMTQKKFGEALDIVKKLQSIAPDDSSNMLREMQVFIGQEKYEEAISIAQKLRNQSPDEPQWVMILVEIYSKQKAYDRALALIEEQLKENPDDLRWIIAKSQVFTEQKKWDDAINWLQSSLRKKPDSQELNLILVGVLADSKKYEEAKEQIRSLLAKEPDSLLLIRLDSQISISMGLHSDAIKALTKVIEMDPKDYTSINNLSWIFSTSPLDTVRNGQKALELAEKACELSQYKKAFILSTLAAAHAELGNFDKAKEWSQKSIDRAKMEKDGTEEEQKELLDNLQKELETFKKDQPYREYLDAEDDE